MEWVKRYWWIAILVWVLPVVINFILQIPAFTPIVGDSETWLSFWGGYIGAIVSAGVAFIILIIQYKQNKSENQDNRTLQVNVIRHQQERSQLHDVIDVSAKILSETNIAKISKVCRHIGEHDYDAIGMLDDISRYINNHKKELELYIDADSKNSDKEFMLNLGELVFSFDVALNDITSVIHLFNTNKGYVDIPTLTKQIQGSFSKEMNTVISECVKSTNHRLDYKHCIYIVFQRIGLMNKLQIQINSCIRKYISIEKGRIDKILTENFKN